MFESHFDGLIHSLILELLSVPWSTSVVIESLNISALEDICFTVHTYHMFMYMYAYMYMYMYTWCRCILCINP